MRKSPKLSCQCMIAVAFLSSLTQENLRYYQEYEERSNELLKENLKLKSSVANLKMKLDTIHEVEEEMKKLRKYLKRRKKKNRKEK